MHEQMCTYDDTTNMMCVYGNMLAWRRHTRWRVDVGCERYRLQRVQVEIPVQAVSILNFVIRTGVT
jgi:hypothetical protein